MIKQGYRADFIKRMCVSAIKVHEALKDVHTAVNVLYGNYIICDRTISDVLKNGRHYFWFPISLQVPKYGNPCAVTMLRLT